MISKKNKMQKVTSNESLNSIDTFASRSYSIDSTNSNEEIKLINKKDFHSITKVKKKRTKDNINISKSPTIEDVLKYLNKK
tara:strand:+ start:8623 stop:8865 length:243 start_codon:yes stop_codon:yes gene_type:complete